MLKDLPGAALETLIDVLMTFGLEVISQIAGEKIIMSIPCA